MSFKKPSTQEEYMSTSSKNVCDNCLKETADWYVEIGWIQIRGDGSISIAKGRKPDRTGDTKFVPIRNSNLDFCSMECLIAYLKSDPKPMVEKCPSCGAEKHT